MRSVCCSMSACSGVGGWELRFIASNVRSRLWLAGAGAGFLRKLHPTREATLLGVHVSEINSFSVALCTALWVPWHLVFRGYVSVSALVRPCGFAAGRARPF